MTDFEHSRVQWPRTVTEKADDYIGLPGEIVIDSQRQELRLHDAKKRGGWRVPNLTQLKRLFIASDSELGGVKFSDDLRGFMVRVSDKVWRLRKFIAGDGIKIDSLDGVTGNITIQVDSRLAGAINGMITDFDDANTSGFYITAAGVANGPGSLASGNAGVWVIAGFGTAEDPVVIQRVIDITSSTDTEYIRRFRSGSWTAWS